MEKLKIVVGGFIGLFPTGGATLDYIQYPLGLKLLGHEVYYIEDTLLYPIYQNKNQSWDDASDCIMYLKKTMEHFGFKDVWAYRDVASGKCYGMTLEKVNEVCKSADVFINISCSTYMRHEYYNIPKRILLDSDPMFTQIQYHNELSTKSLSSTMQMVNSHNYLFSFGENIGNANCEIPTFNYKWLPTRQPVCMELWQNEKIKTRYHFTSIMNWSGRKKLVYNNEEWGQKDIEFLKFLNLPKLVNTKLEIVINPPVNKESTYDLKEILKSNWQILNPAKVVSTYKDYIKFIQSSLAEFSIAKETYIKSKSGWFSCRSACYLASGKPVVAQETGWSSFIPCGSGLFSFTNIEEAIHSINEINNNYIKHSKGAFEIARNYFDSKVVLTEMINQLN